MTTNDSLIPGFATGLPSAASSITGKVVVDRAALKRMRSGDPWLRADDVIGYDGDDGAFADAVDDDGLPVGTVLWDRHSDRRARLLSTTRTRDPIALLSTRLERAEHRRKSDLKNADAFRLCHGDADGVPGVYIDRFGDALHVDVDSAVWLPWLEPLLAGTLQRQQTASLVLRHADRTELLRGTSAVARYGEGQLRLDVDLAADDVRRLSAELDAMQRLRSFARGRTLDVFANGGGFGLHLAQAGAQLSTIVDVSDHHATRVRGFATDNGLSERVEVIDAEPLAWLRQAQRSFDLVVCHPPHERLPPEQAERKAVEVAASALRLVGEGSLFCARTSSNSLDDDRFAAALADVAAPLRRRLQVLARLGPGAAHPTVAGMPMAPSILVLRVLSTG
ncbi:MAG TPA: hypothetical protein VGF99_14240 [Myxococcota bacterium]